MVTAIVHPRALRTPASLYALGAIAVLSAAGGIAQKDSLEVAFHLIPGIAFMLLGPLQFSAAIRGRFPRWHRLAGRGFVAAGLITGASGLWYSPNGLEYGGWLLCSANFVFGTAMLISLAMGVRSVLRGDLVRHRAWMVRAFAIGLGAATHRLYFLPQFLLFGDVTRLSLGLGMWAGWLMNLTIAEVFVLGSLRKKETRR